MTLRLHFQRPAQRFGLWSAYGLVAVVALFVARFIPIAKWMQPWWGCALRRTTGIPCAACGLTRAFDWEAHGHFARAFHLTPLGALAPPACAVLAVWGLAVLAFRAPVPQLEIGRREERVLLWGGVGLVVLNWVYMIVFRTHA